MKIMAFRGIKVKKSDVEIDSLVKALGGEDKVAYRNLKEHYVFKEAELDETQLVAPSIGSEEVSASDLAQTIIDAHDQGSEFVLKDKSKRILKEHDKLNQALYSEVSVYFGTSDREAAMTWVNSWLLKVNNPSRYASKGLIVIHPTTSFSTPGVDIDTEQKVIDYYGELISEIAEPFDDFRDSKVLDYITAKALIEAE